MAHEMQNCLTIYLRQDRLNGKAINVARTINLKNLEKTKQ
jgi:hypothetical protein